MTSKERILIALKNKQPDHVPAAPDFWQMIPIRLSEKKSWDMLVYQDPPIWKANIDACAYFGVDALIPLVVPFSDDPQTAIIHSESDKLITRQFTRNDDAISWSRFVDICQPKEPSAVVAAADAGFGQDHDSYEIVKPNITKTGEDYYRFACETMGEKGLFMPMVCLPALGHCPEDMYEYYDDPEAVVKKINEAGQAVMQRVKEIVSWQPEVLMLGNSGMMLFNPPHIFRQLTLEWFKKITAYAKQHGVLTHIHCCGPEKVLVQIAAEETDLTSIEPLEIAPMGDCVLKEIKEKYGHKLALKGNLHTTEVMLYGNPQDVEQACKKAIDDAAGGGGFILSTGDQTPRDTPDENIFMMQKVAETYGKY